ncbi:hypothetical protein F0562_003727 [Nyssa sinensis]|uniref:AAA+ ATPase domain-containing protein n=1 Tax=Nyssa sinensis TaxID=561372 RepID=A0A5J5BWN8_9ASTE|nr:hypothetical protein F0562_003727 [Nyssa sinensis]
MISLKDMSSPSSMFAAYASMSASIVLFKTMFNQLVPHPVQRYILSTIRCFFKPRSSLLTFIIEEKNGMAPNLIYDASEIYLCTKISPDAERLKISQSPKEKNLTVKFVESEKIIDTFEGFELHWRFVHEESQASRQTDGDNTNHSWKPDKRFFELSFQKKHKSTVLDAYLPFVLNKAKKIKEEKKVVKLHTLAYSPSYSGSCIWDSLDLQHPSTFDTLALDPDLKKAIIADLDRFVERKEFYRRVGKAWKRGYLLYGPPGTGKSSLIAAMANYLRFDVYDLQLGNLRHDSDLRKLLLGTANKSILVIEDVDCTVDLPDRQTKSSGDGNGRKRDVQLTLSGLLNFIDGLWSSCGDERIIIFTTNHKEKLDPALLRPGRMDMHIHMSFCTTHGFKLLASNYLGIHSHWLFGQIEDLILTTEVTPAEVAEELMKSNDADVSLEGLLKLLKRKRIESQETKGESDEIEIPEAKRLKTEETENKINANGKLLE